LSKNIKQSLLSFRCAVSEDIYYEQDDETFVRKIYGLEREAVLNQYLGSVNCLEDRCIVFPNNLQHKVEEFDLEDQTQEGERRILCFFLVNPTKKVLSTKEVAPQQREWIDEIFNSVFKSIEENGQAKRVHLKLPKEIRDIIYGYCGNVVSFKEAKRTRERLVESRKSTTPMEDDIFENTFSLCEH
jgi:hypothetical protein